HQRAGIGPGHDRAAIFFETAQADGPPLVERNSGRAVGAEVLAPTLGSLFVGDPQPARGVIGDRRVGFITGRGRDRTDLAPGSVRRRPHHDVVVPVLVAVPGDRYVSIRIRRD